jgi:lipooligosaccharide transport system permease protein
MTAASAPAGTLPAAGAPARPLSAWSLAVSQFRFWLTNYRRTWRGSIYSSVLNPVLYLGAMGLGLGSLVDKHGVTSLGGVSYLVFLAPGLMAAEAMQTAIGESTYPVLGSVKWRGTYKAAAATPLRPSDILHGHLLFTAMRLAMNALIFLIVMTAFGATRSAWSILLVPVAVLIGLAFATPVEAFAISRKSDQGFALLFRFGMIPLFLFSGTFFPVSQLPAGIRWVAYVTPLWHGVALSRAIALGDATAGATLIHLAYLVVFAVVGLVLAQRYYVRRLCV